MTTLRLNVSMSGGVSCSAAIDREVDQQESFDPTLTKGQAGTLSTRTNNTEGTLTLGLSHGIGTGNTIDIYWDGGMRYGVTVGTVSGTSVPFSSGAGDNLPDEDSDIVATVQETVGTIGLAGNNIQCIVITATKRTSCDFLAAGGAVLLHVEIAAGEGYVWMSDTGVTNPLAGDSPTSIVASTGDSSADCSMKMIIGYDNP